MGSHQRQKGLPRLHHYLARGSTQFHFQVTSTAPANFNSWAAPATAKIWRNWNSFGDRFWRLWQLRTVMKVEVIRPEADRVPMRHHRSMPTRLPVTRHGSAADCHGRLHNRFVVSGLVWIWILLMERAVAPRKWQSRRSYGSHPAKRRAVTSCPVTACTAENA